jgi:hypothetical protein
LSLAPAPRRTLTYRHQIPDGTFHLKSVQVDFRDPISQKHLYTVPILTLADSDVEAAANRGTFDAVRDWFAKLRLSLA